MVTKKPFLNIVIGVLILATLVTMWIPCYEADGDSASLMSYISFPTEHKALTKALDEVHGGLSDNGRFWIPLFVLIMGVGSIILMILRRNMTDSLILPIVFSVFGILNCWINPFCRAGGFVTALCPTLMMAVILVLCIINGDWMPSASEWKRDPSAKAKIKEINAAIGKKNIELLKSYTQSNDPSIRIAALNAIAEVGGSAAFHPIVAQLSSSNEEIRIAAAEALGKLGDSRGRTYLMHFIEIDRDSRVRTAMQSALSKLPSLGAES